MSFLPSAPALGRLALVFSLATPALAEVVVLEAGPSARPAPAAWSAGADGAALALSHALRPVVTIGADVTLRVEVPGAGQFAFVPVGIDAWDVEDGAALAGPRDDREAERLAATLPRATPSFEETGTPGLLHVRDSWLGVDELFALRGASVKHDILVHREALDALGHAGLRASWLALTPAGTRLSLEDGSAVLRDGSGAFLARVPPPVVADDGASHGERFVARLELAERDGAQLLSLVVPGAWLRSGERAFPLHLDPTVTLEPASDLETGFVDELGNRNDGSMASGTLLQVGFGGDVRAFAEFDTTTIPDGATVTDVRLLVWIANHQNFSDPVDCADAAGNPAACPLDLEVKAVATRVNVPAPVLHAAIPPIGGPGTYVFERLDGTGPEWCPDAYVFRDYDLGAQADADLQGQLLADFFTVGMVTSVETDPFFDHIDEIGYPEEVLSFGCPTTDFPGTRIKLVVAYQTNQPPTCDAGGPYLGDCPGVPITLDGTGSSDPDGDPLIYAWASNCSGTIEDADQATATLHLEPSCGEDCIVTLTVSDGQTRVRCQAPVSVHDASPPVVTASALDGLCLWPPRHDLYCLSEPASIVTAFDECQPSLNVTFVGCASDQPDEAREAGRPENGDGHFPNDCQISADGSELCVRVERAGNDPEGRHYGVVVAVADVCGNVTLSGGTIFVPHDRSGGSGGQDDPCERGSKVK